MKYIHKILLILMMMGMVLGGCSAEESEEEAVPVLLETVKVGEKEKIIPVARMDLNEVNLINVVVVPKTEELFFGMDGEVIAIDVVAGQKVEEGDVLATLSQTYLMESIEALKEEINHQENSYSLQLKQAEAATQIAEKELAMLQRQYEEQEIKKQEAIQNTDKEESEVNDSALADSDMQPEIQDSSIIEENSQAGQEESSQGQETDGEDHVSQDTTVEEQDSQNSNVEDQNSQNAETQEPTVQEPTVQEPNIQEPITQEPVIQEPEITQFDLQLAELSLQEVQLSYDQLLEDYNLEMAQREEELQALLEQVGEDTLTAPFSGRVVEVYCAVGSFMSDDVVAMVIVDESQKLLRGETYPNVPLRAADYLEVVFEEEAFEVSYIPYDDQEYAKRILEEDLPTWFSFDCPEYVDFGTEGMVRTYVDQSENALVIPADCIQSDKSGKFVYKAEEGKRVKTYVTLGVVSTNYAEIIDGLAEGDEVYGIE